MNKAGLIMALMGLLSIGPATRDTAAESGVSASFSSAYYSRGMLPTDENERICLCIWRMR